MKQLPYFAWASVCKVGRPLMSSALVSPLHTLSKYTSQMILPQSVNKDFSVSEVYFPKNLTLLYRHRNRTLWGVPVSIVCEIYHNTPHDMAKNSYICGVALGQHIYLMKV